ncbi:MAG TPA: hypothetical protein VN538_08895 [Clostridia bacterium]|nr:hypothetical protein [Clostridia bacterium]
MPKEAIEESESRAPRTKSGARRAPEPGVRVEKPEMTSLGRIGLIISGFIFAGMVLFTLSGYERISRAYADINALNSEIDLTDLRINELDVQIECAVTIQDAQEVAEAYGMKYPDRDQYVRIGDRLPFDNSLPSPTGTTETTTPVPETTPDPTTTEPGTTGGGEQPPAGG